MSYRFDHRQLADEMEIYVLDEQIGAGLPVWLPNGVAIRDALENFVKELERRAGYQRVVSPHLARGVLYEKSGHLKNFKNDMYPPMKWPEDQSEYFLKPMNCPHHHKVFAAAHRSYRQLPVRLAEYGQVYRFEKSGALRGLSRVRGLCQNDAHIYVDPDGALAEILKVLDLHEQCYQALGLKGYRYRVSLHDPSQPEVFEGAAGARSEEWRICEEVLREALKQKGLPYFEAIGEAAFYGPKIDVQMKLASGQEESIASVQLDFLSAERFDLSYVSPSGESKRPWIIHRAPLGSHERFVSLLLEYYDGQLPGWLAPIQSVIVPIADADVEAAMGVAARMLDKGVRVHVDRQLGSLAKRLKMLHRSRPFSLMVIGEKERSRGEYSLQLRDERLVGSAEEVLVELEKRLRVS